MKRMKQEIKDELLSVGKYHDKVKDYYVKNIGYDMLVVRGKCYCGKCGDGVEKAYCPSCKIKLHKAESYYKHKSRVSFTERELYVRVICNKKDWLETEIYLVSNEEAIKKPATELKSYLIGKEIYTDNNYYMSRLRKRMQYYDYVFDLESSISIKNNDSIIRNSSFYRNIFAKERNAKYKYLDFGKMEDIRNACKKLDRKNYWRTDIELSSMLRAYNQNPKLYETLQNIKRYDLLSCFINYYNHRELEEALLTMARNNKQIPDNNWVDYAIGLKELNKDLKNIKVVCPDNYIEQAAMHERKLQKIHDLAILKENVIKYQADYEKRLESIINRDFGNDTYNIECLKGVEDFYNEAKHYCNCCYRMGYFKESNSIVFTIKHRNGERVEMAELRKGKSEWYLYQCYGKQNKYTSEHKKIVDYIEDKVIKEVGAMF